MSSDDFTVKDVVENLEIIRVRYELPDSSESARWPTSYEPEGAHWSRLLAGHRFGLAVLSYSKKPPV